MVDKQQHLSRFSYSVGCTSDYRRQAYVDIGQKRCLWAPCVHTDLASWAHSGSTLPRPAVLRKVIFCDRAQLHQANTRSCYGSFGVAVPQAPRLADCHRHPAAAAHSQASPTQARHLHAHPSSGLERGSRQRGSRGLRPGTRAGCGCGAPPSSGGSAGTGQPLPARRHQHACRHGGSRRRRSPSSAVVRRGGRMRGTRVNFRRRGAVPKGERGFEKAVFAAWC